MLINYRVLLRDSTVLLNSIYYKTPYCILKHFETVSFANRRIQNVCDCSLKINTLQLAILPIQQSFGLIFRERFISLGITATQTSLIVHLNGTITCSLGLISGPMMKRFSFRKVAFLGGFTVAIGISMAAFAVSLPSIIITYCVIVGE